MTGRVIALRLHHIDRFVNYYYDRELFDKPSPVTNQSIQEMYGEDFTRTLKDFFDELASGGTGEEHILVRNGIDSVCYMCPRKKETCSDPDSLSLWNGSGHVMQEMDLREGFLYTLEDFLGRVKQLYQGRNPVKR